MGKKNTANAHENKKRGKGAGERELALSLTSPHTRCIRRSCYLGDWNRLTSVTCSFHDFLRKWFGRINSLYQRLKLSRSRCLKLLYSDLMSLHYFFIADFEEVSERVKAFMSASTITHNLPIAEALVNTKPKG